VLDSLSRIQQFKWLATHPLPEHVRYFSLASFARYADVQLPLRATYKMLERINPLNDGQLLSFDQLIPGSALAGLRQRRSLDDSHPGRRKIFKPGSGDNG
jgi:hypothetical protein